MGGEETKGESKEDKDSPRDSLPLQLTVKGGESKGSIQKTLENVAKKGQSWSNPSMAVLSVGKQRRGEQERGDRRESKKRMEGELSSTLLWAKLLRGEGGSARKAFYGE